MKKERHSAFEMLCRSFCFYFVSGSFDKFVPAFRAGDLDLPFPFWYADGHAALAAAIEFMSVPLVPALLPLLRQPFDLIHFFQEPQPFVGPFDVVP